MVDEDRYWDMKRLEYEEGMFSTEPYIESDSVFVDYELEEIEKEYGCKIKELFEGDYKDIVKALTGILPDEAKYDPKTQSIDYKYEVKAA